MIAYVRHLLLETILVATLFLSVPFQARGQWVQSTRYPNVWYRHDSQSLLSIPHFDSYEAVCGPKADAALEDSNVTVVGRWAWGPCGSVAIQGDFAFIGNWSLFQIVDISNPADPCIIGEIMLKGVILDIAVRSNFAYVATSGGLDIIDISTPTHPHRTGRISRYIFAARLIVSGDYVYIGNDGPIIDVIDVSDPVRPVLFDPYHAFGFGHIMDIALFDNCLFVAASNSRMIEIIDISDPTHMTRVGSFEMNDWMSTLHVSENYLFVGTYLTPHFHILDISSPVDPVKTASLTLMYYPTDIEVSGDHAYMSTESSGFSIVDISNILHPFELSHTAGRQILTSYDMAVSGEHVYLAWNIGLWVLTVSSPQYPEEVCFFPTGWYAWRTEVSGKYAYVADGLAGLWILDVSTLDNPTEEANFPTATSARDVVVVDSRFYLMEGYNLWIGDVSDPKNPETVGLWTGNNIMKAI